MHAVQAALRVQHHILGQAVEQLGHGLVAPDGILNDPLGVKQADILGRVDDVVHEEDIRGDLVAGAEMEPLKGHKVEEHELGGVVDDDDGEAKDAVAELDVAEASCLALLEPDASLVQLLC